MLRTIITCVDHCVARFVILSLALARPVAFSPTIRFMITLKDHQFVPAKVPVPAGVKVQLLIKNEQQGAAEFESTSLHRGKIVTAGRQIRFCRAARSRQL